MTTDHLVKTLIRGCIKGDQISQLRLYEHFYSYGMGVCLPYTKNRQEALEVLNDGFLKVFRKIHKYDPTRTFKPWLRRILINATIDYYHRYYKQEEATDSGSHTGIAYSQNLGFENLAYEDLIKVMQMLTPAYRIVFNLFVVEGLSHREIADRLGVSTGTSKSNLAKARQKLQYLLRRTHGGYLKSKRNG